MAETFHCWKCDADLGDIDLRQSRYHRCPQCGADLHVCRMCAHFDERYANPCREERAEAPRSKDTANFCDWLNPRRGPMTPRHAPNSSRDALDALFGEGTKASDVPNPLDDLFRK